MTYPRERILATISALIGRGITDTSLTYHLQTAKSNGIDAPQMAALLTHLGFYAGWPAAWAAFRQAVEVYKADLPMSQNMPTDTVSTAAIPSDAGGVFGLGEKNDAYAAYFVGQSYLNPVTPVDTPLAIHNVTFEPSCRNNWHTHTATQGGGQLLLCHAGHGWYQAL